MVAVVAADCGCAAALCTVCAHCVPDVRVVCSHVLQPRSAVEYLDMVFTTVPGQDYAPRHLLLCGHLGCQRLPLRPMGVVTKIAKMVTTNYVKDLYRFSPPSLADQPLMTRRGRGGEAYPQKKQQERPRPHRGPRGIPKGRANTARGTHKGFALNVNVMWLSASPTC